VVLVTGIGDQSFAAVHEAFTSNFADGEVGASCCVIVNGKIVLDIAGGDGWTVDTLCNAYSVGKPFVALSVLQLVADGRVDLDAQASTYWPELTTTATVRECLSHQAGVGAIRERLTNDDLWSWDRMCAAVAATEPWYPPGSRHSYHTNTYGFLAGEIARRVTGDLPGTWLRRLDVDAQWGVLETDLDRCADVLWDGPAPGSVPDDADLTDEQRMIVLGYSNPIGFSSNGVVNTREWRQCQVPSTNLHASARGIASMYARLLDGSLLDAGVLREATTTQSEGWCPVLERDVSFGLGFQPTRPDRPLGPNPGAYGHFGTGGALGFADPVAGVAFGYVMSHVKPRWQSSRNRRLLDALYSCL
jgi:CubicO group peptidase (beta-lactamase class C family)